MNGVDAHAVLETLNGRRNYFTVCIGNFVHTPNGYKKVLAIDFGVPQPEDRFVLITRDDKRSIVLQDTHTILGIPAIERLDAQAHEAPEFVGDLRLDGSPTYYANGILVDSMMEQINAG